MTDGLRRDNNSSSFLKPVSGDIHDERRFSCWQQKVWEFSWLLNKFDDDLSLIYQCTLPYSSLITHKDKDECTVSSYWSPGPVDLIYYNFFLGSKITTKLTSGFLMCSNNSKSFKKSIGCYISRLDQQLLYTIHWFSAQQKSVDFYQNLSQLCTLRFRKQFIKMFCRSAVHHDLLSDKSISDCTWNILMSLTRIRPLLRRKWRSRLDLPVMIKPGLSMSATLTPGDNTEEDLSISVVAIPVLCTDWDRTVAGTQAGKSVRWQWSGKMR